MNKAILLEKRPVGLPQLSDFKFVSNEIETITEGELLLKTTYVSVDPYLRGRMNDVKSYIPPFELHKPISSGIIAEVIDSKNTAFKKGDFVSGMLEWKEFQKSNGEGLIKADASKAPMSTYLGVLGLTGLTAYLGLTEIGKPKKGETVVVSGAAGAVGSIVGQIAKLNGCKVIGIAGSDEKVAMLKSDLGFDEAINYNTTKNMAAAIKKVAPDGVDIYFDNVGGPISDAVLLNINQFARFIICGAISIYNNTELPKSISVQPFLIRNSALMQGFIVFNYAEKYPEAIKQLSQWLAEGKLSYTETIVEGFDAIPQAFLDLFEGKNKGKMLVKI
ncbi:NADP-dependent oxidoreductase [Lutimonas halocynthiae]|uniref:NADP-dependent oxidoreductase n=1 Tax=Lutimonas halocynthiae TaxID=1446477 RepID=UPI0025B3CB34|nr:NADP-dependent oxidoreductase [Lutimonas halocynthiae]MDN3643998.1 NADP-dependent oxidoreductase [Lutimonas halocynthiae]